jgi:hypothetical protein
MSGLLDMKASVSVQVFTKDSTITPLMQVLARYFYYLQYINQPSYCLSKDSVVI